MNDTRPQWLKDADAGMARHQELAWARYVETPALFAEGLEYSYTNENGETAEGTCTGLMIQPHNQPAGQQIRRVVMVRKDTGKREYPRVLDVDLD